MNDYYSKKLFIAQVDEEDNVIGPIERWKAHEKGILHRGFTVELTFEGKYLLQHRKHKVFDKVWDLTFSSHQIFEDGKLESDLNAIYRTLKREWNLRSQDLTSPPHLKKKFYYQAKDSHSIYIEHEWDYVYHANIKILPTPNLKFAYGYEVIDSLELLKKDQYRFQLAPWVKI